MEVRMDGRVALITGGSKGLGFAMGMKFAEAGAEVALISRNKAEVDEAASEISLSSGLRSLGYKCDVSKPGELQETFNKVNSDFGKVDAVGQETCAELACYDDVLTIAESSLDEEEIFQLKSYAKGVGNIEVGWRGEAESKEELGVREFGPLSSEELESYRILAMAMEAHAYEVSPDVYGQTEPLT